MRYLTGIVVAVVVLAATAARAAEPEHGYFTTKDGVKIHYMTLGDKGSWVVLIHGFTGSAEGNWFRNGIAEALSKNHHVVALDCRNHGRSDKPNPGGSGEAKDVVELMDHLKIAKAHIHGYSMGGSITARLMGMIPERMITAAFGGSGVPETDPDLAAKASAMDKQGRDPQEDEASRALRIRSAMDNGKSREEAEAANPVRPAGAATAAAPAAGATARGNRGAAPATSPVDLKTIKFPVIAIVGEFDNPHRRTERLKRELPSFKLTVLPGKSHLTAISAPYIPKEYGDTLIAFIDGNDQKP